MPHPRPYYIGVELPERHPVRWQLLMAVVAAIVAVGLLLLGVGFAVQDSVRTVSAAVLSRPQVVPGITPCGLERGDGANDPFELG